MQVQWDPVKKFIIAILSLACICLIVLILSPLKLWHGTVYIHILVFATAITLMVHCIQNKRYFYGLLFIGIMVIYNPFTKLITNVEVWTLLNIMTLLIFMKAIFEISYADKLKEVARIATKLNSYLQTLEKQISHLTYHETVTVIKREYGKSYLLDGSKLTWQDYDFPDFEFYILSDYFSQGGKNKGGVSVKGKNVFTNIEVHLNFNLTHHVKYTVREEGGPLKTSLYGKKLKSVLIRKYEYVDLAKIIGI